MKSIEFPEEMKYWRELPVWARDTQLLAYNLSMVGTFQSEKWNVKVPTLLYIRDELVEDGRQDRL